MRYMNGPVWVQYLLCFDELLKNEALKSREFYLLPHILFLVNSS